MSQCERCGGSGMVCPHCEGEVHFAESDKCRCTEPQGIFLGCGWEGNDSTKPADICPDCDGDGSIDDDPA